MQTKSFIQLQLEAIQSRSLFCSELKAIVEKYNVEDAVFGISGKHAIELSRGYFVPVSTYETIEEAVRNMESNDQAIRLTEGKIILGNVFNGLSECDNENEVFNIEFLENVY